MKISRKDNNPLNSLITIDIERNDFEEKSTRCWITEESKYPGFRKGHAHGDDQNNMRLQ